MTGTLAISPRLDTSALTVSGFSLDGANTQSMIDLAGTWNTSAAPTGFKFNITDTASAAASLLFDFQHSGTSFFNLRKDGRLVLAGRLSIASTIGANILGMTYTDATGNSAPSLITVSRNTSGTPAAGLGTLFDWNIDSSTTINRLAVRLTGDWLDATDATRTSEFKIITVTNGANVSNAVFASSSIRGANGTAAAPAFCAINFTDTGMYFPGAGTGALAGGGAQVFSWVVGGVTIPTAKTLSIQSGANQRAGNLTLVAGTKTTANTTVTANTIVMLTKKTDGGTLSPDITYTVSAGVSFTVNSASALDTSTFSYLLIEVP